MLLVSMVAPNESGFGSGFAIELPFMYGMMGFIFTAIACAAYSPVAGCVGGIEVEVTDRPETYSA